MRSSALVATQCRIATSWGITQSFDWLCPNSGYVSYPLLTLAPLGIAAPCDLHALATPPAFTVSQDQTLQLFVVSVLLVPFRPFERFVSNWKNLPIGKFAKRLSKPLAGPQSSPLDLRYPWLNGSSFESNSKHFSDCSFKLLGKSIIDFTTREML